ncbi:MULTISPECIES: hypothetical protein [Micrococcaceae]|uniref:hypothetical protein n=1 Tax=Micrococcaceae TaxID=1268 RepID=UPI0006FC9D2C|nr:MULTISPECIES: hypothetical protein [Micrococcaceae]KQQ82372.1 hypothetical protein ASF64_10355 [Arthrobacter sp. Leaf137]MCT9623520.1 hypothetical protein [Pseudarthrobacter equi]MDQ1053675.1 hypothetical protein [Arthrobacter sp. SORGH_AS_0212]
MMTPGNPFHDPFASSIGPARMQEHSAGQGDATPQSKGVQSAAELKALRAASLARVSKDLERMLRVRAR